MRFFVAGTDTDVGKTVVCALLARGLREQGIHVAYQKWVTTGYPTESGDARLVKEFAGIPLDARAGSPSAPFCFSYPASPHLAAEMDSARFEPSTALDALARLSNAYEAVVVEGVGGLMVPLTRGLLLIDMVARSGLPVLLVARSGLGTINHTLLSLEALEGRGIPVAGVVFNTVVPGPAEIAEDNRRVVARFGEVPILGTIPHLPGWRGRWGEVAGTVGTILENLRAAMEGFGG